MDDIIETLDYDIVRDDFPRELLFFRSLGRKISFVDCAILYHSRMLDVRFASFDKELNKL